jgi:hypothetical protein
VVRVSADQSQISTDITNPPADGTTPTTVSLTVKQTREEGGEALGVAGLAASNVVLTVTPSTGVTITQPTGATNQFGAITGSFVSTNAATVSVGATVLGEAITGTATVIVGGGAPPDPPPGDPFFSDDFSTGSRTNANGFTWNGTAPNVFVSDVNPRAGQTHSLHFVFGPDPLLTDDTNAEQRFAFGRGVSHLWLEYWLYVPSNYVHRDASGSDNNKFMALWRDTYSDVGGGTWRIFWEMNRGTGDVSTCRFMSSRWDLNSATDTGLGFTANGSTVIGAGAPCELGSWTQVRLEIAPASGYGESDGIIRIWFDGTLFGEQTNAKMWNFVDGTPTDCVLKNGYFLGWSNSGFLDETTLQISEVKFYESDPGWL